MQVSNLMNDKQSQQHQFQYMSVTQQRLTPPSSPCDLLPTPYQHQQQYSNARRITLPSIKSILNASVLDNLGGCNAPSPYMQYAASPSQSRSSSLNSLLDYQPQLRSQFPQQAVLSSPIHNSAPLPRLLDQQHTQHLPQRSTSLSSLQTDYELDNSNDDEDENADDEDDEASKSDSSTEVSNAKSKISVSIGGVLSSQRRKNKTDKKRSNLPKKVTVILLNWLNENLDHPYPNSKKKTELMSKTGLTNQQLSNWFINARRRKVQMLREIKCNSTVF